MKRNGKKLAVVPDGHPRRLSDARNAVRKMNTSQLGTFLDWMHAEGFVDAHGIVVERNAR